MPSNSQPDPRPGAQYGPGSGPRSPAQSGRAGSPLPDDALRASDAERDQVVSLLGEGAATGRLELSELEDRIAAAYAVKTRGELRGLVADLPAAPPTTPPAPAAPTPAARGRRGLAAARSAPYGNWLLTAVICLSIWAATSVAAGTVLYFWPFWVIVPWGAVLLAGGALGVRAGPCGRAAHTPDAR